MANIVEISKLQPFQLSKIQTVFLRSNSVFFGLKDSAEKLQINFKNISSLIFPLCYYDHETNTHGQIGAIVLLSRCSGARINEILRLTSDNIVGTDSLIIRAEKKSRSRIVRVPELSDQLQKARQYPHSKLFSLSYSQVWRQYVNHGISFSVPGDLHRKVTHSFRYQYISDIHHVVNSVDTTAECVGHRSSKSTEVYLKKGIYHG